ncbi:MAG TPA: GNAT family N-acetyltransferase [Gaiellaceae bacterium]
MRLETERLVLRVPRLEDAPALLDFVGDPEVMRRIGSEPGGLPVATEHVERWIMRWETNGIGPYVVVLKSSGQVLGRVGLLVWNARTWETSSLAEAGDDATVELGWALGRAHWGAGYATEAARTVRESAYETQRLERLISLIDPENARSVRVAVKLGAEPTETVRTPGGLATIWVHPR